MNMYTREIMKLLNVDVNTALQVQEEMEIDGFDFSESSQRAFNKCAKQCYKQLKAAK